MNDFEMYEKGMLNSALNEFLEGVNNESKIPGTYELKVEIEESNNYTKKLNVTLVPIAVDGVFQMKNPEPIKPSCWFSDEYLSFTVDVEEDAKFMGTIHYDKEVGEKMLKSNKYHDGKKKPFMGMRYLVGTFTRMEIVNLNKFLSRQLGFPVEFDTKEPVNFKKNYISLESQLRESIGIFSRMIKEINVAVHANDNYQREGNLLYFGVSVHYETFSGGGNGMSLPFTDGNTSFYFDKVARTWHPISD